MTLVLCGKAAYPYGYKGYQLLRVRVGEPGYEAIPCSQVRVVPVMVFCIYCTCTCTLYVYIRMTLHTHVHVHVCIHTGTCTGIIVCTCTYTRIHKNNHVHSGLQFTEREQRREKEKPHAINKVKFTKALWLRKILFNILVNSLSGLENTCTYVQQPQQLRICSYII